MLFCFFVFFDFLFMVILRRLLPKKTLRKNYHFVIQIIKSVCEKFWFIISSRLSKIIFFNFFFFFTFPNFNWLLPKILRKNHLFYNGFRRFFDNKTTALLTFFEISAEMHYASLSFLNERNITTLLLMKHLKCTVLHYADLNLSYINKPYLQAVEYAILFFLFFSISYLWLF